MTTNPSTIDPYSRFFKENIVPADSASEDNPESPGKYTLSIPVAEKKNEEEGRKKWRELRKFFIAPGGVKPLGKFSSIHISDSQFDYSSPVNYPFLVIPVNEKTETVSFKDWLESVIGKANFATGVIDNLKTYLARAAGKQLGSRQKKFKEFWQRITLKAVEDLKLKGGEKKEFEEATSSINDLISEDATIIGFSSHVMIPLLHKVLMERSRKRKSALAERINKLLPPLLDILEIEKENQSYSRDPDHLKSAMSYGDHYFDFEKLANVLPESASEHLPRDRFERIQSVIHSLELGKDMLNHNATIIIEQDLFPDTEWEDEFAGLDIQIVPRGEVCQFAKEYFEEHIRSFSDVIKSLRIGKLEKSGKYRQDLHDEIFNAFNWRMFDDGELDIIAPVIVLADASVLVHEELAVFSQILGSDMPVKTIGFKLHNEVNLDPLSISMAHRNTFVAQLSSLDPKTLFEQLRMGIANYSPAFIQFRQETSRPAKKRLIRLSASLESREFPVFSYNGIKGTPWGSRFDVSGNPQNDKEWPVYSYEAMIGNDGTEISAAFTIADYLTLEPEYARDFLIVAPEYWSDNLVPVDVYMGMESEERYGKLPFVWLADHQGNVSKAVVSLKVIHRCEDKLDFWNFLQDSGGIHSFHAEEALKAQEKSLNESFEKKIRELKSEFEAELDKVATQSAEQAMDQLTAALLDLDPESLVDSRPAGKPEEPPAADKNVQEESEEPDEPEEVPALVEEPWIETPLCTNCNECVDINSLMFKYNDDKMAYIADASAGTFAQLVEAAEKCPVHIIHPGKPLNPEEPGLPELIEKARKYN